MALNLLQENSQADIIANPKVVAQDGRQAEMRVIQEEWFMMQGPQTNTLYYSAAQLQKIESGTVLTITPHIGDNNDITLQMAVEVSDSIPKARGSDLPLVTRRTAKNAVTIKDGGTVAVGGLTENRSKSSEKRVPGLSELPLIGGLFQNKNNDKATREVAVFVTAHLVPQNAQVASSRPYEPAALPTATDMGEAGTDDDFANRLREAIARQR
jgi:general secretion pathway protein D